MKRWVYLLTSAILLTLLVGWYTANANTDLSNSEEPIELWYLKSETPLSLSDVYENDNVQWQRLDSARASFGYTRRVLVAVIY